MKKNAFKLFIILISLMCIKISGSENLVKNGDFEEIIDNRPAYWSPDAWQMEPNVTRFYLGTENPHSGKSYVGMENIQSNDSRYNQYITVEPNSIYKLSCWIRAKVDHPTNIAASITVFEPNFFDQSEDYRDTNGKWQNVSCYVKTSSVQTTMAVCVRLGQFGNDVKGTAEFDDFSVEKVTDAANQEVLYLPDPTVNSQTTKRYMGISIIITIIIVILVGAAIAFGIIFFILKPISKKGPGFPELLKTKDKKQYTRLDYILCGVLTVTYAIVAYINLGSFLAPQTQWKPAAVGDSFYVDLGSVKNVQRIYYYQGLSTPGGNSKIMLETSTDANKWEVLKSVEIPSIFYWCFTSVDINTRYIKVTAENPLIELKEMAFIGSDIKQPLPVSKSYLLSQNPGTEGSPDNVFDEQNTWVYRPSMMSGMTPQFDETYHVRTAYEMLIHNEMYETSHPPLGKVLIAFGITLFGMVPFGFRFMGTTLGIIMVILMYIFGKRLFKRSEYAFIAAFMLAWDFMHFVQTRLATIDTYPVFFIILMYYFMYKYYTMDFYKTDFKKTLAPLFYSGLFWGLGVASKWILFNAAFGLVLLFFLTIAKRIFDYRRLQLELKTGKYAAESEERQRLLFFQKNFAKHIWLTGAWCVLFFIVIPAGIYVASYIPFMLVKTQNNGLKEILYQQKYMWDYHASIKPEGVAFQTAWYEWPLIRQPYWYYGPDNLPPGKTENLVAMGNPAVWWVASLGTLAVLILSLINFFKRIIAHIANKERPFSFTAYFASITETDRIRFVILIFFLSQYLPWAFSPRKTTYIYHYFASVPFIILALVSLFKSWKERTKDYKGIAASIPDFVIICYLAIILILFILFYPVLSSNTIVDKTYLRILKWLPNWPIDYM